MKWFFISLADEWLNIVHIAYTVQSVQCNAVSAPQSETNWIISRALNLDLSSVSLKRCNTLHFDWKNEKRDLLYLFLSSPSHLESEYYIFHFNCIKKIDSSLFLWRLVLITLFHMQLKLCVGIFGDHYYSVRFHSAPTKQMNVVVWHNMSSWCLYTCGSD